MHKFTTDEIQMLAEMERKMDSGEYPFVMYKGGRMAVPSEVMVELNLQQGQTITTEIAIAITEMCLRNLRKLTANT